MMSEMDNLKERVRETKLAFKRDRAHIRERAKRELEALRTTPEFLRAKRARDDVRRRRLLMLLLFVLLLFLLLRSCSCTQEPELPSKAIRTITDIEPIAIAASPVTKKKKFRKRIPRTARPALSTAPPPPPPWLSQYRLQVSARGPQLAKCFAGRKNPGALRWSALVHAKSGVVTEAVIENVFRGEPLSQKDIDCLLRGLTADTYTLDEDSDEAAPRRVSIVFEF